MPDETEALFETPQRRSATIYDVAKATGVSPSTVSRALNRPGRLNERTERRIREAADELGYSLNPMARALPTGKTGMLGLLLSDITNPVYFDLIREAEQVATASGLALILADSQESASQEIATARKLMPTIDGLILVASRLDDQAVLEIAALKPVVTVNRHVDGVPSVVPDVVIGLQGAVTHLKGLGHQRLGYLGGPIASSMSRLRWQALFREAVSQGLSIVELGTHAPTVEGGSSAIERVQASGVTAVVTYNDLMAMGLVRAYQRIGRSVPGDMSIVGFDNIFGADLITPPLTTIESPLAAAGECAVRMLVTGTGEAHDGLQTRLVVRNSTGAPPDDSAP